MQSLLVMAEFQGRRALVLQLPGTEFEKPSTVSLDRRKPVCRTVGITTPECARRSEVMNRQRVIARRCR